MLNYKTIYLPVAILLLTLAACNPLKKATGFSEETNITAPLFANVEADSVWVYKTAFVTKYVENRNALEFALLNESQLDKSVKYLNVEGDRQDVYLFRLVREGKPAEFMYASAKYVLKIEASPQGNRPVLRCIGFGPAYWGRYSSQRQAIYFSELWKIDRNDNNYTLEKLGKTSLVFVLQDVVGTRDEPVAVQSIAFDRENKIAGTRPVVFPIPQLLQMEALEFNYHTTIKLK
jgi:hypothetical protein